MLSAFRLAYAGLSGHLGEISRAVEMKEDEAVLLREELAEIIERDNRRQFLPDWVHFVMDAAPNTEAALSRVEEVLSELDPLAAKAIRAARVYLGLIALDQVDQILASFGPTALTAKDVADWLSKQ